MSQVLRFLRFCTTGSQTDDDGVKRFKQFVTRDISSAQLLTHINTYLMELLGTYICFELLTDVGFMQPDEANNGVDPALLPHNRSIFYRFLESLKV